MAGLEQMSQYGPDIGLIHVPCVLVAGDGIQIPDIKNVDGFTAEPDAAFKGSQLRLRNRRIQQDAFVVVQRLLLFFRQFRGDSPEPSWTARESSACSAPAMDRSDDCCKATLPSRSGPIAPYPLPDTSVSDPLVERSCAMMGIVFMSRSLPFLSELLAEEGDDAHEQQHG